VVWRILCILAVMQKALEGEGRQLENVSYNEFGGKAE
jgi:hypothetical protein